MISPEGLSEDTSLDMNSKKVFSLGRCGGATLTPPVPTTTISPFSI